MRHDRGFTLLEVLVAFIIAALALGALTQGALGGLHAARISGHYQEAVARARTRLAVLGHASPLVPGDQQGDDGGGFRWRVRVTQLAAAPRPPEDEAQSAAQAAGVRQALYGVSVVVSWRMDGGERQVVLNSERVAVATSAPP